jgi:methionyl-tRNA synthetase
MIERYREGTITPGEVDPSLREDFFGLSERVSECLDRVELTLALEEIWQRVRRLNRYVEERAPWLLAKDAARADDLDLVLRTLAEGIRCVTVLLWPYLPASSERLLAALGTPGLSLAGAALGTGGIEHVNPLEPLFPKERREQLGEGAAA